MGINDVYLQAKGDILATKLGDSVIYKGVKIEEVDGKVVILNTNISGDFYRKITKEQTKVFLLHGFRQGCYNVCIDNYNRILREVDVLIRQELKGRNNIKHHDKLKEMRNEILIRYSETIKLKYNGTRQQLQH